MSKAQKIVGFGNDREKNDFYATPQESTESLLRVQPLGVTSMNHVAVKVIFPKFL